MIDAQMVEIARHFLIERVIAERGIKLRGKIERVGPCPVCAAGRDRFAVNVRKQLWNCRICGEGGSDAISLVQFLDGCDFASAVAILGGMPDRTIAAAPKTKKIVAERHRGGGDQLWNSTWKEAGPPHETPVDFHLARRRLILPPDSGDCLRFHPRCVFGKNAAGITYAPCMVALVRNVITNQPQAIHRTALDQEGHKVEIGGRDRMALGPIASGAVKLTADEDVTIALGIGEGIETALSLQRIPEWAGSPVWSVLNANGVASFPLLAEVETLAVAVDHDVAGEKAALAVAERWRGAGREVLLFEAVVPGNDMNDALAHE